jgi:hypothetical protein
VPLDGPDVEQHQVVVVTGEGSVEGQRASRQGLGEIHVAVEPHVAPLRHRYHFLGRNGVIRRCKTQVHYVNICFMSLVVS